MGGACTVLSFDSFEQHDLMGRIANNQSKMGCTVPLTLLSLFR